ncbi:MAG: N-acetylglucosamine-6-phosphate deacetylase [Rubrivivax sp.]
MPSAAGAGAWCGHVLTPQGFLRGRLAWDRGRITGVEGDPVDEAQARGDAALPLLLPGFVDLHLHGGGGADTMDGGDAVARIGRLHACHGTTSWLATTMTAPLAEVEAALCAAAPCIAQRPAGAARVLGVHLEGPWVSPGRLGAQPPHARPPTLADCRRLQALAPLRVVTLAPELDGAMALVAHLVAQGVRVQIGHSGADYDTACHALRQGASGFTHLFNAFAPFHHRAPGAVGAALAHAEHAELIPDGLHVHPGAMRAALRAIPRLHVVTDATAAAGMPDGEYRLGAQTVRRCGHGVRLADGTLAGSSLTMDEALRQLVSLGLPLAAASAACSTHAADYLGLADRGRLQPGAWADVVELEATTLRVRRVAVEGEPIAGG